MGRFKPNAFLLIIFTTLLSFNSIAQTARVRGFIYNNKTGEAEIGATVYLKGTTMGAATDINGFYSISKVPAGTYTLRVTSLGFDTLEAIILAFLFTSLKFLVRIYDTKLMFHLHHQLSFSGLLNTYVIQLVYLK